MLYSIVETKSSAYQAQTSQQAVDGTTLHSVVSGVLQRSVELNCELTLSCMLKACTVDTLLSALPSTAPAAVGTASAPPAASS
jgi:hypothetical protein